MGASAFLKSVDFTVFRINVKTIASMQNLYQFGHAIWWSDAPMAVYTFLESCDWTGKTLVPFNTSASGGFGRSLSGIEESAAGAEVLEGLDLTESELSDAESRISEWLTGLGLTL